MLTYRIRLTNYLNLIDALDAPNQVIQVLLAPPNYGIGNALLYHWVFCARKPKNQSTLLVHETSKPLGLTNEVTQL